MLLFLMQDFSDPKEVSFNFLFQLFLFYKVYVLFQILK